MNARIRIRGAALPLLALVVGGMALAFASDLFFYVFYVLLLVVLVSFLWVRLTAGRLRVTRELRSDWVQVGDQLRERFTLTNASRVAALWVEIADRSNVPGYDASRVEAVGGSKYRKWVAQARCTRRGLYTLGPITVRIGDPFGIFSSQWDEPAVRSILVYPPILELPGVDMPRGTVAGASRTSFRTQQVTTNVATVREYLPGDSLNRIHWPSTARQARLFVKEFDLEPSGHLWIVLDLQRGWHAGDGDEASLEYAINIAGSLAHKTLADNRSVGLLAYGANLVVISPDKGLRQLRRILESLAVAELGDRPLAPLLTEMSGDMGRGMTVAVITPSADPAWIEAIVDLIRRGLTPAAVVLDSRSFGGSHDSAAMMGELARFGVRAHLIRQGQKFTALSRQRKSQGPVFRTLATGRVILTPGK